MAESYFSRLRRAEIGTHHHIVGRYLGAYAAEMDWREDNRRESNGAQFDRITRAAAAHPVSRQWKGYWQRRAA
jgi:ISXO2-like transposase domain